MTATLSLAPPSLAPVAAAVRSFRTAWDAAVHDRSFVTLRDEHLPWLAAEDLGEFAHFLSDNEIRLPADAPPPVDREQLVACVIGATDLPVGDPVARNLVRFREGQPTIRVAHQPNFLPSLNVALQPVHQHQLARLIREDVSELLLVVDYDVTANRRYRNAQFPSPSCADGYLTLSAPADPGRRDLLMRYHEAPEPEFLQRTLDRIWTVVQRDLTWLERQIGGARTHAVRARLADRRRRLYADLEAATKAAYEMPNRSLPDFNASFLATLVNRDWQVPTIFLRGRQCLPVMAEHIVYLWDKAPELTYATLHAAIKLEEAGVPVRDSFVRVEDEVPFWLTCGCGRRIRLFWKDKAGGVALGHCPSCRSTEVIDQGRVPELAVHGDLVPRVVADDLLDGLAWRHRAGCGYRGGLEHHVFANLVASLMGLPQVPEFLSRRDSTAELSTIDPYRQMLDLVPTRNAAAARKLLADGRGSVVHSLLWAELEFATFEKFELLAH